MSAFESIIIGIISGSLATAVILLISNFMKDTVLPWYSQLVYKGLKIDGGWKSSITTPSGNLQDMKLLIKQRANIIEADMTVVKTITATNEKEIKQFEMKGEIKDRFLAIYGRNKNPHQLGVNLELLEVVGDGNKLKGKSIWYSVTVGDIECDKIEW